LLAVAKEAALAYLVQDECHDAHPEHVASNAFRISNLVLDPTYVNKNGNEAPIANKK
jgi:hypothetical protein